MGDVAPSRNPAIDKALKAALAKLSAADNDYARLLAVRNGAQELLALGPAAKPAIEQIRKSAITHGIADAEVGKILEDAAETSNVRPLRSNGSAGSAMPPPSAPEMKSTNTSSDSELDELNEKYAVVPIGGNVRVMDLAKETPTYYRVTDFRLLLGNRTKAEGKKHVPLAAWWLSEPRRRQYEGVCFEPGKAQEVDRKRNLWTGFAVTPKPGNCVRYLDFLREVICSGSQAHYDYLVNVMAEAVQRPNKQGDVAVVLRGLEGVGKGFSVNTFGHLFGRHFVPVTHASHLTGKFNGHLAQCSLLFADEAFFAGDRQHDAVLKALITEPTLLIERKGVDVIQAQNKTHLWIASNESWVVPAGPSARRYFCLDVADAHRNDSRYFEAIAAQMRSGGYEALLHTLLNRDVSKVNIREVPQTEALAEQKAWSRRGPDALVEWVAHEGVLPCAAFDPSVAITSGAEPSFYDVAKRRVPDLAHKTPTAITRALTKEWRCTPWHAGNQRGIQFPPLPELRGLVDAKFGPRKWPEIDSWGG